MITAQQVIETMREVVAEKGEDYVYPKEEGIWVDRDDNTVRGDEVNVETDPFLSCAYLTVDDQPSCIVGHVLHRLGVDHKILGDAETVSATVFGTGGHHALTGKHRLDEGAARILSAAQQVQDNGAAWGLALREVEAAFAVWQ